MNLYTVKIMFMPSSEQVDKLWLQQHNPGEVMNTRSKRKRSQGSERNNCRFEGEIKIREIDFLKDEE